MINLALQLWSVKDEFQADYENTLKEVAALGFQGVEFAGFYDIPAQVMKEKLDKYGLKAAGSHTPFETLTDDLDEVIRYNKAIENKNIVCPYYEVKDEESLQTLIQAFRPIALKLKEEGLNFYYHNHSHELFQIGNEYALDLLYKSFEADELKPEIDTYWIYHGGLDPIEYCRKYNKRCDLIHLKDGTKTESRPIGNGEVDIKGVLAVSEELHAEWVIMEDESTNPKGMESVKIGMDNLKKLINS